jgi:hypothetical protein
VHGPTISHRVAVIRAGAAVPEADDHSLFPRRSRC